MMLSKTIRAYCCEINAILTKSILWLATMLLFCLPNKIILGQAGPGWSTKTLIVILPANKKKIEAWQEAYQRDSTNLRVKNNLVREIRETKHFAKELQEAFEDHFNYSSVRYISDSSLHFYRSKDSLVAHQADGQEEKLNKRDVWYLVRKGVESGAHGLVLCDENLEQIPRPFPSFYRLNRFGTFLGAFFNKSEYGWRPLAQLVSKMEERLLKYDFKSKR